MKNLWDGNDRENRGAGDAAELAPRYEGPAFDHATNCRHQILGRMLFVNVSARTNLEGPANEVGVAAHGEEDNVLSWSRLQDGFGRVDSIHPGHVNVCHDNVGGKAFGLGNHGLSVGRGSNYVELDSQEIRDQLQDCLVIVNHQDPRSHRYPRPSYASGLTAIKAQRWSGVYP
jgi:hypothetical protein